MRAEICSGYCLRRLVNQVWSPSNALTRSLILAGSGSSGTTAAVNWCIVWSWERAVAHSGAASSISLRLSDGPHRFSTEKPKSILANLFMGSASAIFTSPNSSAHQSATKSFPLSASPFTVKSIGLSYGWRKKVPPMLPNPPTRFCRSTSC